MLPHHQKMLGSRTSGARTFFGYVCPLLLRERATLCRKLGGRYAFVIRGDGGGEWLLDFERCAVAPTRGDADVTLSMSADDFDALLRGELDGAAAVSDGRMRFSGDQRLVPNLARFTAPL